MSNHPKTKQVLIKKKLKRKNNFSNDVAKSKTYQYFQKYEISQPFSIKGILSPNLNGISELFQKQVGSNNSLQPYFILWSFPSLQSLKAKNRVVSSSVLKDVQVNFTTRQPRRGGLFRSTQVGHCRLQGLGVDFDAGLCSEKSYQSCRDDGETNQACIIMILLIVFSQLMPFGDEQYWHNWIHQSMSKQLQARQQHC